MEIDSSPWSTHLNEPPLIWLPLITIVKVRSYTSTIILLVLTRKEKVVGPDRHDSCDFVEVNVSQRWKIGHCKRHRICGGRLSDQTHLESVDHHRYRRIHEIDGEIKARQGLAVVDWTLRQWLRRRWRRFRRWRCCWLWMRQQLRRGGLVLFDRPEPTCQIARHSTPSAWWPRHRIPG
ncbi:uncharacterized protein LOC132939958 [Metopolophium dirhodum]|uniref:uncharacterized protein LOC132939958 n=1 Tax=Metopolophium dirhodum TaxID=44670 RepID=UPI0029900007|nr:uncharacterized protein LOC132939958 [Metopolophium dirhodum]